MGQQRGSGEHSWNVCVGSFGSLGRPSCWHAAAISTAASGSDFGLLREDQRVVNLDAEVANRALQLGMAEEQLAGSDIAGSLVDQRDLCAAQAVRAERRRV